MIVGGLMWRDTREGMEALAKGVWSFDVYGWRDVGGMWGVGVRWFVVARHAIKSDQPKIGGPVLSFLHVGRLVLSY